MFFFVLFAVAVIAFAIYQSKRLAKHKAHLQRLQQMRGYMSSSSPTSQAFRERLQASENYDDDFEYQVENMNLLQMQQFAIQQQWIEQDEIQKINMQLMNDLTIQMNMQMDEMNMQMNMEINMQMDEMNRMMSDPYLNPGLDGGIDHDYHGIPNGLGGEADFGHFDYSSHDFGGHDSGGGGFE